MRNEKFRFLPTFYRKKPLHVSDLHSIFGALPRERYCQLRNVVCIFAYPHPQNSFRLRQGCARLMSRERTCLDSDTLNRVGIEYAKYFTWIESEPSRLKNVHTQTHLITSSQYRRLSQIRVVLESGCLVCNWQNVRLEERPFMSDIGSSTIGILSLLWLSNKDVEEANKQTRQILIFLMSICQELMLQTKWCTIFDLRIPFYWLG